MSTSLHRVALVGFAVLGAASLVVGAAGVEPERWSAVTAAVVAGALLLVAGIARPPRPVVDLVAVEAQSRRRRRVNELLVAGADLTVAFQPVRDLATGQTVGYEALARFDDVRPPDHWFAEAAAVGLDVELDLAAITQALRSFRGAGYLSLNVRCATVSSPDLLRLLDQAEALPPLVVELTEAEILTDDEHLCDGLDDLRARGVQIAVDDVGQDAAALRHVLALVPDLVKLDRSLIANVDRMRSKHAVVASLAEFCRELGIELVAEGIETPAELAACETIGVTFGQGFLLGGPAPATAVRRAG